MESPASAPAPVRILTVCTGNICRSPVAERLLQAGLDMFKLQKHLGHKSITTTINRYSHLLPEAYDDAAAAMDRAFGS